MGELDGGIPAVGENSNPRIGLRSTGLVVFSARIISAVTGLAFAVMVARWLVAGQFGLWEFVVTLVSFASYPVGLVSYWATRDVARGRLVGRTAYAFGLLLSLGGLAIYFAFSFFTHSSVTAAVAPFLVGGILVPLSYWSGVSGSLMLGYRPVAVGLSLILGELSKLAAAYIELYVLKAGLVGVLLALVASYSVQSLAGTYLSRGASRDKVSTQQGKKWLSLAALPALTSLPAVVLLSDTFFASLGFGTTIVGYYQAAFLVASVVGYSGSLTTSLYPMLLRRVDEKLPSVTLEFMLLFAIPMTAGGIVLARPIMYLFGTAYVVGTPGLQVLCVMFLFFAISGVLDQTLTGAERVDEVAGTGLRKMVRSNLVFVPVVNIVSAEGYIIGMLAVLSYATSVGFSYSLKVSLWAAVQLCATAPFVALKLWRARRVARFRLGRGTAVFSASSAVMALTIYGLSRYALSFSTDAPVYGAELGGLVALGAIMYFGLVYATDRNFRLLAHSILAYLR